MPELLGAGGIQQRVLSQRPLRQAGSDGTLQLKAGYGLIRLVRDFLNLTHTDRVVTLGVITKVWEMLAGPVTLVIIARCFTPAVQGYYYTFASILALQVFAELGLGQVIVQFASHEWAHLHLDAAGRIEGDEQAKARLLNLGDWPSAGLPARPCCSSSDSLSAATFSSHAPDRRRWRGRFPGRCFAS